MKFWNFKSSDATRAELLLYGDISSSSWFGDEVTPKQFKADLDALGDVSELDIYINSGGGDVFAGFAIYNMLKRHAAKKTVYVDGLAASIASVIAMAGDKIIMPENAMMMIHNAWAVVKGNKAKLRKIADEMDKIDGSLAGIYAARTGKTEVEIVSLLDAETWFTAQEAVDAGLADELEASKMLAASVNGSILCMNGEKFDLSRYKNAPQIRASVETVEVVYGPPCSGKSTYVRENMGENDVVYDYDRLIRAMTNQEVHGVEKTVAHDIAIGIRGLIISRVKEETPVKKAWIITRWPTDTLREKLDGLNVTETRMNTDRQTCLERLESDETRTDKDGWREVIDKWFEEHGEPDTKPPQGGFLVPDNGGESQPVADNPALQAQRRRFNAIRTKILRGV